MSKRVSFLDNPPRGAKRAAKRGRKPATKRAARKSGKTKRQPPNGFASWKAYMASIRPGAKRANPSGKRKSTVAKKRGKRRASATHKTKRYTRRRRSNPPMFGKLARAARSGPAGFAVATLGRSVAGVSGEVVVRKIRGLAKQAPGTIVGSIIEAVAGLALGYGISRFHEGAGVAFAQGAVSAPLRTAIQQRAIPHISDSLGDDGYLMGPGTGVTLISAYPDDYSGVVQGNDGDSSLGRYVSGDPATGAMQGYVAGAIG